MRKRIYVFLIAAIVLMSAICMTETKKVYKSVPLMQECTSKKVMKTMLISHRGYTLSAPENTLEGYKKAKDNGFWGGETDITTTKDGKWIVMHDDKIDRMTDGRGLIKNKTLKEIKRYRITKGKNANIYGILRVPTFDEYLKTCKHIKLKPVIEFKSSCDINKVKDAVDLIKKYKMEKDCICISFNYPILQKIREYDPDIKIQLLIHGKMNEKHFEKMTKLKPNAGVDLNYKYVTKDIIKNCHEQDLKVNCWTLNDVKIADQLTKWGVDSITSDKIKEVK